MTIPDENPAPAPRRGRRQQWALAASLALNLLLVGLGAGMVARAHMGEGARAFLHGEMFRDRAARDIDERASRETDERASRETDERASRDAGRRTLRAQVRAVLDARAPAFDAARARVAEAWRAVRAATGEEPLRTARLEAALADLRAAQQALTMERHAALVTLAARLSPEERARMMRGLERVAQREGRAR